MPATKVQLTGGQFQDAEGNKLALGYLIMKLAMDANITRNLSIMVLRLTWTVRRAKPYAFFRTPNSPLRAAKTSPIVACIVMSVAAVSGPNS